MNTPLFSYYRGVFFIDMCGFGDIDIQECGKVLDRSMVIWYT